jgi:two-component system, sensor histidine kinase and response regulator
MAINGTKILIIDDEEKILTRIERILEKEDYSVDTAPNGITAIEKIRGGDYDIVITDINMPDKSGFEIMEFIKNNRPDILPLVLTGYASVESAIRSIKLGAYDFIQKPVDIETLKHVVKRAVERVTLKKENEKNMLELQKLNELKDEFISVVSHDLRSPLSSIGGYANYLLKRGNLTETQNGYLLIIKEIAENLYGLVNELLDISKIEAGVMQLAREKTDLGELITTSINYFIILASEKNTLIFFDNLLTDPMVSVDRNKMLQVINNLINNAVKFTENGRIVVTAGLRDAGKEICISIQDSGTGIPAESLEKIFDKYALYHTQGTRGEGGTGLGLVICKRFVDLHGGTISARSVPGEGTVFDIMLPVEQNT